MNAIRLQGLVHHYDERPVLRGLDLTVPRGAIWGLVGENGAGKTTTLRILATLLEPSAGLVEIEGVDVREQPRVVRSLLGYMPDGARADDRLTVDEHLEFFAAAWGLQAADRRRAVEATLELCRLGPHRDRIVPELSKGLRQRVLLARTLLHDPTVLALDEPASDLDPRARIELRALLGEIRRLGKTILLSSHILSELEPLCDGVAILSGGRVVAQGDVAEVARRADGRSRVELRFTVSTVPVLAVLAELGVEGVEARDEGRLSLPLPGGDAAVAELVVALSARGLPPVEIVRRGGGLEGAFLDLTARGAPCS